MISGFRTSSGWLIRIIKGGGVCYTCGLPSFWKYQECGHFKGRKNMSTRFELVGSRPQCDKCNCFLGGNLEIFRKKLIEDIGLEEVEEIEMLAKQERKWGRAEMREAIEECKKKVRELAKDRQTTLS